MNRLLLLLVLCALGQASLAQRREFGASLGTTLYKGELASQYNPTLIEPAVQLFYRLNRNPAIAHRFNAMAGFLRGNSSASNNLYYEKVMDLSFRTPLLEASYLFEYNFLDFRSGKKKNTFFTPYLTFGVAGFYFQPKEEEGKRILPFQPALPIGGGIKYALSRNWNLTAEFVARKTFTGYLDNVHDRTPSNVDPTRMQRGYRAFTDWYMFTGISLSYVIYTIQCPQEFMR